MKFTLILIALCVSHAIISFVFEKYLDMEFHTLIDYLSHVLIIINTGVLIKLLENQDKKII